VAKPVTRRDAEVTTFLNVDLDVLATFSLRSFVTALGDRVWPLRVGREGSYHGAHLELASAPPNADLAVRRLAALVVALPPRTRTIWDRASSRAFNIGFQSASAPISFEHYLSPSALHAAADINCSIVITVYAPISESTPLLIAERASRATRPPRAPRGGRPSRRLPNPA
jgi:hypothetical protein